MARGQLGLVESCHHTAFFGNKISLPQEQVGVKPGYGKALRHTLLVRQIGQSHRYEWPFATGFSRSFYPVSAGIAAIEVIWSYGAPSTDCQRGISAKSAAPNGLLLNR
jgi:hypothetical protein